MNSTWPHTRAWTRMALFLTLCAMGNVQALCQLLPAPGYQLTDRARRMIRDAEQAVVTLTLDKAVFFPGEGCRLTIRVTNPTPSVLEVPDPFDIRGASTDVWSQSERWRAIYGTDWAPTSPHPNRDYRRMHVDPPGIFIPAGNNVERQFECSEKLRGDTSESAGASVVPYGLAALAPGRFRIVLNYPKSPFVEYRVVPAILEAVSLVALSGVNRIIFPSPPGTVLSRQLSERITPRRTYVAAYGGDGGHWIIASTSTGAYPRLDGQIGASLTTGDAAVFGRIKRVGRSDNPIVAISGVADPNDNITITWTDTTGRSGSVRIDRNREILPR